MSVLAAVDVDLLTDIIGLPLAAVLLGLLLAIDLLDIDPDGSPVPAFLAKRRTLVVASALAGLCFLTVVVLRIVWLAA